MRQAKLKPCRTPMIILYNMLDRFDERIALYITVMDDTNIVCVEKM